MNNNHLQETARHYAQLAEQAQVDLQEANEINGELLGLIEALCEHFDLNMEELLEMTPASKHGPTDAKPVDPNRPAAIHGPTAVRPKGKGGKHLKAASKHGPTDAKPVDPNRPAAIHGPTV